jgi:hypothetical protein
MLELDVHPEAELFEIETTPVDSDLVPDTSGLFARGAPGLGDVETSWVNRVANKAGSEV